MEKNEYGGVKIDVIIRDDEKIKCFSIKYYLRFVQAKQKIGIVSMDEKNVVFPTKKGFFGSKTEGVTFEDLFSGSHNARKAMYEFLEGTIYSPKEILSSICNKEAFLGQIVKEKTMLVAHQFPDMAYRISGEFVLI